MTTGGAAVSIRRFNSALVRRGMAMSDIFVSRCAGCQLRSGSECVRGARSDPRAVDGRVSLSYRLLAGAGAVRVWVGMCMRVTRMNHPALRAVSAHNASEEHCA